jgi:nucleotide-binding universal stress UspA family protein
MTATSCTDTPAVERLFAPRVTGPIVLATDGRSGAHGAADLARLLVQRTGAELFAIAAIEPAASATAAGQGDAAPEVTAARARVARERVDAQLRELLGERDWPIAIRTGVPAVLIAREAAARGARFLLLGTGRHGIGDRMVGRETVLQALRLSPVPVLAVPPNGGTLPTCAVVAVDFSRASVRAARLAAELLQPGGELMLVHVARRWSDARSGAETVRETEDAFTQLVGRLRLPRGAKVRRIVRTGSPADEILALAATVGADLIATGAHGHGFLERLLVGSVATRLVRRATCAVLAVPLPTSSPEWRLAAEGERTRTLRTPATWARALSGFSERNAGRRCRLEIDDPQLGAQPQVRACPLLGVAYDHTDGSVAITLGHAGDVRSHLGHIVRGASGVDILSGADGVDRALRIGDDRTQTLLTFVG